MGWIHQAIHDLSLVSLPVNLSSNDPCILATLMTMNEAVVWLLLHSLPLELHKNQECLKWMEVPQSIISIFIFLLLLLSLTVALVCSFSCSIPNFFFFLILQLLSFCPIFISLTLLQLLPSFNQPQTSQVA